MNRRAQLTERAATATRFVARVDTVAEKNEHKKVSQHCLVPVPVPSNAKCLPAGGSYSYASLCRSVWSPEGGSNSNATRCFPCVRPTLTYVVSPSISAPWRPIPASPVFFPELPRLSNLARFFSAPMKPKVRRSNFSPKDVYLWDMHPLFSRALAIATGFQPVNQNCLMRARERLVQPAPRSFL